MFVSRQYLLLTLLLGCSWTPCRADEAEEQLAHDEKQLKESGLPTDGPGLLEFFRKRTLSDADRAALQATVRKLGDDAFEVRERAALDLVRAGRPALLVLRPALMNPDAEIANRAGQCIEKIEEQSALALPAAAARLLAVRKPAGAVEVLLAFAPFAEEEPVEEAVRQTLAGLGLRDGKASPRLVTALTDREPARRTVSAACVGRATDPEQRRAVVRLLADPEARVRFQAASALLSSREKSAIPALLALLTDGSTDLAWRSEELLWRLAGEKAPAVSLGSADAAARRACREAWEGWWKANAPALNLAGVVLEDKALGLTLIAEFNVSGNHGRVSECGRDGKTRWEVKTGNAIDAQLLPGGNVLVASQTGEVLELDRQGKVLWSHKIANPLRCQRLPNGNTFIATYNTLTEVTREGKAVYSYNCGHCYHAQKLRQRPHPFH